MFIHVYLIYTQGKYNHSIISYKIASKGVDVGKCRRGKREFKKSFSSVAFTSEIIKK